MTKVMDLRTGDVREYTLSPIDAVAAAYAQVERIDFNTWEYNTKYRSLVKVAPCAKRPDLEVVTLGNQSTLCVAGWADKMPEENRPFRLVGSVRVSRRDCNAR